jgi:hypothetical protein
VGTAAVANAAGAAAASSAAGAAISSGASLGGSGIADASSAAGLADASSAAGLADSASAGSALGDAGGGGRSLSDLLSEAKDAESDVEDVEERADDVKKKVESDDPEAVAGAAATSATRGVAEIPAAAEFADAAGLRRDPRSLSGVVSDATDTKSKLEDLVTDAKRQADDADREHGHGDDPNIEG